MTELSVQTLMISVVPGDGGKPTTKLEKATILDDICRWEKPVYESVKFVREPKTGKINERTYHFILSSVRYFWLMCFFFFNCYIINILYVCCRDWEKEVWLGKLQLIFLLMQRQLKLQPFLFHWRIQIPKQFYMLV